MVFQPSWYQVTEVQSPGPSCPGRPGAWLKLLLPAKLVLKMAFLSLTDLPWPCPMASPDFISSH